MNKGYDIQDLYKRIGKNIAFFRKKKKLTQAQLAKELYLGEQSLISQYENAKKAMSLERIKEFADFFGQSLEEFIFTDANPEVIVPIAMDEIENCPIKKLSNRTYYGYYLREQNKGSNEFSYSIASFELKILKPQTERKAVSKIIIKDKELEGVVVLDDNYAHVVGFDARRNFFVTITFFYNI